MSSWHWKYNRAQKIEQLVFFTLFIFWGSISALGFWKLFELAVAWWA